MSVCPYVGVFRFLKWKNLCLCFSFNFGGTGVGDIVFFNKYNTKVKK